MLVSLRPLSLLMRVSVIILVLLFSLQAFGQLQNSNWCFGNKAGLNFTGGTTASFISAVNSGEGGATVSHRTTGALLFYTDGVKVWNRQHDVMPNGTNIGNDNIATCLQGATIIPFASDSNRYYVFTLEPESFNDGALFYSVIDMSLNGGLGDVVTGMKKIRMGDGFVEGMVSIPTCDGHWLLLSSKVRNEFSAYRISTFGVDTNAVISEMPYPYVAHVLASIKASPDGQKILYTAYTTLPVAGKTYSIITLHDFDENTGVVSNGELLDEPSTTSSYYSGEFSQDGSKVYICDLNKEIIQYDLNQPDLDAIKASRKTVHSNQPGNLTSLLQMAPDGNIYVALDGKGSLGRIENTNAAFPGCTYNGAAVTLAPGTVSRLSLPPTVTYPSKLTLDIGNDTLICAGDTLLIKPEFTRKSPIYRWQDGSTEDRYVVSSQGTYYVAITSGFCIARDTIEVAINDSAYFELGNDTLLCTGAMIDLAVPADVQAFTWSTGATDSIITVDKPGTYYLYVERGGCNRTDTMVVKYTEESMNIGNDTILCIGEKLTLDAASIVTDSRYLWSTGEITDSIVVSQPGLYTVNKQNICGVFNDSILVDFKICDCEPAIPNIFTPNNDGLNDKFGPILKCISATYDFIVINRFGEVVFKTNILNDKWDGTYKGQPAEVSTYYYQVKIKNTSGTDEFYKGDVILIR